MKSGIDGRKQVGRLQLNININHDESNLSIPIIMAHGEDRSPYIANLTMIGVVSVGSSGVSGSGSLSFSSSSSYFLII